MAMTSEDKSFIKTSLCSFTADTGNLTFAELFGNMASSTPMKGNFNSHNGNNINNSYIQTTPSKNSFENFQVRIAFLLFVASRLMFFVF